jgi:hypothetical protein
LVGEHFEGLTALGRPVPLVLHKVQAVPFANADARLDQFTVSFEGPRHLPLPAGLHTLQHPGMGSVSVYLEPVDRGERLTYAAHFSLMA